MHSPISTTLPVSPWSFLAPPQSDSEIGRLAQYRVLRPLGAGGMGMVFLAEDTNLRRQVALKVMKPDYAADPEGRARFLREAQAAAALKHDHIVTIYQVGEDRGVPFLAMELLPGKSLDEWLRPDRRATAAELLIIGKQIAKGLAAAHKAGLVHRDIKPANLWIETPYGRIKILDFGLARLTTGDFTALTQDGQLLGTPAYMAPEQARGEPTGAHSDLFSLGVVFYRMATGRLPFQGNTLYAVLAAVAGETPTPVRQINDLVPERLAELIERLLAKSPADRPPSAQAVLDELLAIEREQKDQRLVPPPIATELVPAAAKPVPRATNRGWWIAAAIAFAACLVVVAVVAMNGTPTNSQLQPAGITGPAATIAKPPPAEPQKPQPINLSVLLQDHWREMRGTWHHLPQRRRVRGYATVESPEEWFGLVLPWEPPAEYRLKFRVMRVKNESGQFVVGLAQGDERFNLMFDLPSRGRLLTGINKVNGESIHDRNDPFVGRVLPDGISLNIAITVRPNQLTVEQNDNLLYEWTGPLTGMGRAPFQSDEPLQIGGVYPGDFTVEEIVIEPLGDDPGRLLAKPE